MSRELLGIFFGALLVNNFTLSYFLGLCPFFGVSGRLSTAFRLGLANVFVMTVTSVVVWFLDAFVALGRPLDPPGRLAQLPRGRHPLHGLHGLRRAGGGGVVSRVPETVRSAVDIRRPG